MNKNVLILSSSLRKGSNSDLLAEAFLGGAKEAGHQAEKIELSGKTIGFCKGCLACQKTLRCVIRDDADGIAQKMGQADTLVFATPVYYYSMCGQLKTMLDRANPLYSAEYKFRNVYLLASAAEADQSAVEGTRQGIENWLSCFEKAEFGGCVFAGGVDAAGEVKGHRALEEAYEMGKTLR